MTRNNSITSEYDRKKRFWELIESNTNDTSFSNELNRLKSDRFGSKVSSNEKRSQMSDKTEVTSDNAEQTSYKTEKTSYNFDKISNFSPLKLQTKPKFEKVHAKDFDKIKEFDKVLSNFSENFVKETNKKEKSINQPKEKRRNQERFSSKTSTYHVLGLDELTRINKGIRGIRKKDDKEYVIEIKAGDIPKKSALKPESKKNEVKKEIPVIKKYTAVRVTNTPEVKETVCPKNNFSFTPQTENKRKNTILVTEPISPNSPLFSYSPKSKIVFNNNFKKYTLNTEECFKNIKQNFFNKNEEKEETNEKMHEMKEIQTKETTHEIKETKEHEEKEESLMKSIENISVHSKESNKKENFENNIGMKEDHFNYKNLDKYEEITLSTLSTSTVNLYSPGKVLKDFPKLKILHIEYSLDDTFLIIKVNDWLIRKNYDLIRKFIKPNEALTYDPYKNKINKEIIEINLNSKLMKDIPSLQSFILTDLIDNYSLKNDFLLMYDKEWSKVKLIKVNDKFILYRKNEIYKMFSKKEINLEKVNNLVFKLYLENAFITLGVNSLEEMNEWIEFINS